MGQIAWFLVILLLCPAPGIAAPNTPNDTRYHPEETGIPETPSVPAGPAQKVLPVKIPHCERYVLVAGKKMECDSDVSRDAERLRPLLQNVPAAVAELDTYQKNQKSLRIAAYVETAGFLLAIGGFVFTRVKPESSVGEIMTLGGGAMVFNGLVYSFSLLRTNEKHLQNAVNYYNAANPESPIELQFSTQIHF